MAGLRGPPCRKRAPAARNPVACRSSCHTGRTPQKPRDVNPGGVSWTCRDRHKFRGLRWPRALAERRRPRPTPTSRTTTSRGCTCWSPTGRSSPTSPSPTSCCGCPTGRATGSGAGPRCGRRPARPPSSTTWSAPSSRAAGGRCWTPRSTSGRIAREGDPEWRDDVPVRVETIPVRARRRGARRHRPQHQSARRRTPSRLELTYLQTAERPGPDDRRGAFPFPGERRDWTASPRVGDGFVRTDAAGVVTYASPNALSAYRRLGWPATWSAQLRGGDRRSWCGPSARPVDEALAVAVSGAPAARGRVSATATPRSWRGSIPLRPPDEHEGALVLLRDVTELRRRERELITKDATIREIHHRVKNNLQTVAALLRLQARRMDVPAARAALDEAVRRVGSIAIVHETLSQAFDEHVDFDEIADRLAAMVAEVGVGAGRVRARRDGQLRRAAGRDGDAAVDGPHRAAAERRRARLRRTAPARRRCRGAPAAAAAPGDGRRRRARAARGLRPGVVGQPGAADRADAGRVRARRRAQPRVQPGGGTRVDLDIPVPSTAGGEPADGRSPRAAVRRRGSWRGRCGA